MNPFVGYVKGMLKKLAVFTLVVTLILFLCGYSRFIGGWLVGSGLNLVYFLMLSSRSARAVAMPPAQAVAFIRAGALLRLMTIVLALIVITQIPAIHFGAAVAGVLSFKVLIFLEPLAKHIYSK